MKKTILSLITVMTLTTTATYATNTTQDDKTQKKEQYDNEAGPRRPPMRPRIQPTENCKCNTCEQLRKMEQEMQQRKKEHKEMKHEMKEHKNSCNSDSCHCQENK